jgi:hypothetical protein
MLLVEARCGDVIPPRNEKVVGSILTGGSTSRAPRSGRQGVRMQCPSAGSTAAAEEAAAHPGGAWIGLPIVVTEPWWGEESTT